MRRDDVDTCSIKSGGVCVANHFGSSCLSDSPEASLTYCLDPHEARLVPKKREWRFLLLLRTEGLPANVLFPWIREEVGWDQKRLATDSAPDLWCRNVGVAIPTLPGWWEHLPIEVVGQIIGSRPRNRWGFGCRGFLSPWIRASLGATRAKCHSVNEFGAIRAPADGKSKERASIRVKHGLGPHAATDPETNSRGERQTVKTTDARVFFSTLGRSWELI